MNPPSKNFCFCTLALGKRYRLMAGELAQDLEKHSPGTTLVICTDAPENFKSFSNVAPYKHVQRGIHRCYHDKRFAIEKAIAQFPIVILVDADTRIVGDIPEDIDWQPGITSGTTRGILIHGGNKDHQMRLACIWDIAKKLGLSPEQVDWTEENFLVVTQDQGKELEFLELWGKIGRYFELNHIHSGSGNAIGLAAAAVGWRFQQVGWQDINAVRQHFYANTERQRATEVPSLSFVERLKRKLVYHSRLNRARIVAALNDFRFYYR
ncbi:MAG: hypothetical protein HC825_08105 [Oscillatoriales cyanobacterium RM1_1_9]|nr:hypothetical protein [Oscillatoriales cyanobacterium RM1_1_9]